MVTKLATFPAAENKPKAADEWPRARGVAEQIEGETLRYGPFLLDFGGFTVTVHGRDVPLTFSEFLLLKELASHPNRNIDRATLLAVLDVRAFDYKHGLADPATARVVDLHISRLRRKLKERGYDCIRTMRFVGYRFSPTA